MERKLWPRDRCWWCEKPVVAAQPEKWPYWTHWATYLQRKVLTGHFYPVCALCFEMDKAVEEAKLGGSRFSEISVWERHHCGRTIHASSGSCLTCARELRMIDRKWSEVQIARRMANQLLREARRAA
jgi:hypothetical protein